MAGSVFRSVVQIPFSPTDPPNWEFSLPEIQGHRLILTLDDDCALTSKFSLMITLASDSPGTFDFAASLGGRFSCRARLEFPSGRSTKSLRFDAVVMSLLRDPAVYSGGHFNLKISVSDASSPFIGLPNQGATCYLNSLLQALFHLPIFRRSIFDCPVGELSARNAAIVIALQRLFFGLQARDPAVHTRELTEAFGWDDDQTSSPEDVTEFYRFLLNCLHRTSVRLFELVVRSSMGGVDVLHHIALAVKGCADVSDSLLCSELVWGSTFVRLPEILCVQLERFEFDAGSRSYRKLNSLYKFPEILDISDRGRYELASVLVHCGHMDAGHYTAVVRPTITREWFEFNDRSVRRAARSSVFEQNFGGTHRPSSAYFLIYVNQDNLARVYDDVVAPDALRCVEFSESGGVPTLDFVMTTEEGFRLNSDKLNMSLMCPELKKKLTFAIGIPYRAVYETIAKEWDKNAHRIRIWTVGVLGALERPLPASDTLRIEGSLPKIWFVQDIESGENNLFVVFLHFFFPGSQDPFQFVGTRSIDKTRPLSEMSPLHDCYYLRRGAAVAVDASKSPTELMLPNGCCLCFQTDQPFLRRGPAELDCEIPFVSSVATIEPTTVSLFFEKYSNVYQVDVFHYLSPTQPLVKFLMKSADPLPEFKGKVAEWSACEFDPRNDAMLLYATPTSKKPINESYLVENSKLYFLIFYGAAEYENMMKIIVQYRKTTVEVPVLEDETVEAVADRLVRAGLIPGKGVRFLLVADSKIVELLTTEMRIISDRYMLKIEDCQDEVDEGTHVFVATAMIRRRELVCFGTPFVLRVSDADTGEMVRRRIAEVKRVDVAGLRLAVNDELEFDNEVRFLDNSCPVVAQLCGERNMYALLEKGAPGTSHPNSGE